MDTNPIDLLRARGFVADITDEDGLRERFDAGPVTYYVGFDPTAESLHIGNLVGIMAMAWLQRCGHVPIALAGGATGRVGDPSFKDEERSLLDDAQIDKNLAGIRENLGRVLDLSDGNGMLVDNWDWTRDVSVMDFLRDIGKHFSVNAMIAKESVKKRLTERDQGISFTEFSYQLLQAFDFDHLFAAHGCILQGGGSDQWGNITAGIDLVRRRQGGQAYGLTWPLVERADGKKFSKSTGTAVWLSADMTSPYAYYQWFVNVPDADVIRFLRLFTFLDLEVITKLEAAHEADPRAREAHRVLAAEVTRIMHGDEAVEQVEVATAILFGSDTFAGLDDGVLGAAFDEAPSIEKQRADLDAGLGLLDVLREVGAATSNGQARKLVSDGAVRLNNTVVDDPTRELGPGDLASPSIMVLQVGKKRRYLARFL